MSEKIELGDRVNDKFWIVWLPSRGLPKVQHATPSEAIDEAQRIAGCEKQPVFVCECIGVAAPQSPPVVWTDFRTANAGAVPRRGSDVGTSPLLGKE